MSNQTNVQERFLEKRAISKTNLAITFQHFHYEHTHHWSTTIYSNQSITSNQKEVSLRVFINLLLTLLDSITRMFVSYIIFKIHCYLSCLCVNIANLIYLHLSLVIRIVSFWCIFCIFESYDSCSTHQLKQWYGCKLFLRNHISI